jgi:hypothetical protein
MKRLLVLLLLLVILLGAGVVFAAPDSFNLSWWTVDGGGAVSKLSGGSYSLQGTTGQVDAGLHSNGSFILSGGFWNPTITDSTNTIYLPIIHKQQ